MICYLVRHGKDDETVRGGWSDSSLCEEGKAQVEDLADRLIRDPAFKIDSIFSSDLERTRQTTSILNRHFQVSVEFCPQFREVNNGLLAGVKNEVASVHFPGLYWNTLGWEEAYPDGESPKDFYERISMAWIEFKKRFSNSSHDAMLVTHGGVINVIQCIEHGIVYSNKSNPFPVRYGEIVTIKI